MKTTIISARIVALFGSAILISFIPEYFPDFFGDWMCKASEYNKHIDFNPHSIPELHWGYRHYLFFTMGLVLFIIQAVTIVNQADKK